MLTQCEQKVEQVVSGVDWLTATTPDDKTGYRWYEIWKSYAEQFPKAKWAKKDWQFYGYDGVRIGGMSWGYNKRWGYLLMCGSSAAGEYWAKVCPTKGRITRIDLQVTVRLRSPMVGVCNYHWDGLTDNEKDKRKYGYFAGSQGGKTLYVGSRNSGNYGRIYDKGIEAKTDDKGVLWRYETEIKKPYGSPVYEALYERMTQNRDVSRDIVGYVHGWFESRGITPIFQPDGVGLVHSCGVAAKTKSVDQRLAWLRSQVQPTVRELIGLGHGDDVIEALGLDRVFEQGSLNLENA